jgi:ABC-2 type transport system ATP-binding protein
VLGKNITESREEILSCVGYLPSEAIFYKGMKVSEILSFSAKMRKKDCTSEAKILCERLELDTTKSVEELSFGNRKKLGIICAIQHNPELYILDEPTSGLDPLMQKEFYTILKEKNEQGATVFLSSHVLSEVQKYCKNAGIIRKGHLLTSGSVASLGHTGVKRVFLRGADSAPEIPEIKDLKTDGDMMSFLYSGDVNELLAKLSTVKIADLNITDPELDEVFMHYYTGGENI